MKLRDGVEAFIAVGDMEEEAFKALKIGDVIKAEVANIDTVERRLIMSARSIGETTRSVPKAAQVQGASGSSKATLGDLLKNKLGDFNKG